MYELYVCTYACMYVGKHWYFYMCVLGMHKSYCMYVCMFVCMFVCIHNSMDADIHICCMNVNILVCRQPRMSVYVCIYVCTNLGMFVARHEWVHTYILTCKCVCVYVDRHTKVSV